MFSRTFQQKTAIRHLSIIVDSGALVKGKRSQIFRLTPNRKCGLLSVFKDSKRRDTLRRLFALALLLCAVGIPVRADTAASTIETDIAIMKTEIQNLNSKIDDRFNSIGERFNSLEKRLDGKIDDRFNSFERRLDSIEKNFDRQNSLMIACIAIPIPYKMMDFIQQAGEAPSPLRRF